MKTITEYQPMIFSHLAAMAGKRGERRRKMRNHLMAATVYTVLGLALSCDTGFVAWNWQFWTMFAPFLAAGELASREVAKWKTVAAQEMPEV